ncbi:MAG TPA: ABC transporter permease [Bryobacteraceae bacterium]|nr:ABC transporter permease [Bryobacteraceae bacterium]
MRFPWDRMDSELDRELAHHLHHLAAEYERQGHSREEARQMAQRDFGGSEQVKEQCRDERSWAWLAGTWQDVIFGLRMMHRTPVITLAAVLSLALGIGANTAIVSLMDVVLWRDLPVPNPKQLVLVHWQGHGFPRDLLDSASGSSYMNDEGWDVADFFSYPSFQTLRKGLSGRASLAAFTDPGMVSVSFSGRSTVAQQRPVSGNLFSTLQVRPQVGRLLSDADDSDSAPATAVVSHQFWVSALGSNPAVIGKTITVNSKPEVIVGVLAPSFYGLVPGDTAEIYTPLHHGAWQVLPEGRSALNNNRFWGFQLIARRAVGASDAQLLPVISTLFRASWSRQPKNPSTAPRIRLDEGDRGLGFLREEFRSPLLVLGGLVGLLLAIACTNIVNLLLARAVARQREVTVRVALGCSRARLMRQFVTESTLLAALGGAISIGIGFTTANLLGRYLAGRDGRPITVTLDFRVLATVGAITTIALLLFGVFPAFQGSKLSSATWGRPGASGLGIAGRKWSVGRALVMAQMAMSVILVLTAVVFTRNLLSIQSADPGFDRRNLVLFGIRPGTSGYDKARLPSFYFNLEQRLAATPGAAAVGMASVRPMNIGGRWDSVRLEGQTTMSNASINGITPGYLPVFVSRMIAGRNITRADINSGAKVAVLSEDLARKLGERNLLGRMLEFPDGPPGAKPQQFEIVGVAPVIAATSMKERPYAVWLPIEKDRPELTVVVRTTLRPQIVLPAIRQTMSEVDPNLPLVDTVTMEEQIAKGLQRERMFATLCTGFGVLALALSVVGLYGVIAYSTSRRRGEIGVRLALGATPRDVITMVLREGMILTALGMLMAIPVVWLGARYVTKMLFDMKPLEPVSIVLALAILLAAAFVAVSIPALRASALEPAETLRQD